MNTQQNTCLPSALENLSPEDQQAFHAFTEITLRLMGLAHARNIVSHAKKLLVRYNNAESVEDAAAEEEWLRLYDNITHYSKLVDQFDDLECTVRSIISLYDEGRVKAGDMPLLFSNLLFLSQLSVSR